MKKSVTCCNVFICALFIVLGMSSEPQAQQPGAIIKTLNDEAMVSIQGQPDSKAKSNMVLSQNDVIQTQINMTSLEFSDGSTLELGAYTMLDFAELSQEPSGARHSHLYLLWGHVRAFLSQEHQRPGSSFKVETLNALVNVTFSQPDIEVFYQPETDTTTVLARTVSLLLTNLLTGEVALIPPGHTGVVREDKIEDIAALLPPLEQSAPPIGKSVTTPGSQKLQQLVRAFEEARQTRNQFGRVFFSDSSSSASSSSGDTQQTLQRPQPSSRVISPPSNEIIHPSPELAQTAGKQSPLSQLSTGAKIALGAGALAVTGGVVIAIADSGDDNNTEKNEPFTGSFVTQFPDNGGFFTTITLSLNQNGDSISGQITLTTSGCCTATSPGVVSGTAIDTTMSELSASWETSSCTCTNGGYGGFNARTVTEIATLANNDSTLQWAGLTFERQ